MTGLSIIIPANNEAKRVPKTISTIVSYLEGKFDYEIIIIDDGSTDNTIGSVKEISRNNQRIKYLINGKKYGKGYSVKKGMLSAEKEYLLFSDADLSTPIEEVEKLITWCKKGYDIAIGSRGLKESQIIIYQPFHRRFIGSIFNKLIKFLSLSEFSDTQCGFKLFKKDVAKKIFSKVRINHFAFDVEALYIAKRNGYLIKEIPVRWINSPSSRVNPIFDSIKMLIDLLKIKFLYKNGE